MSSQPRKPMTDYPTREDIETTRRTLVLLIHRAAQQRDPTSGLAWNVMEGAVRVLNNLDAIPGLQLPEPKPQRTASQVLNTAWARSADGSPEEAILFAVNRYAKADPELFDASLVGDPVSMLMEAGFKASDREHPDYTAAGLLMATSHIATAHPDWFDGQA